HRLDGERARFLERRGFDGEDRAGRIEIAPDDARARDDDFFEWRVARVRHRNGRWLALTCQARKARVARRARLAHDGDVAVGELELECRAVQQAFERDACWQMAGDARAREGSDVALRK